MGKSFLSGNQAAVVIAELFGISAGVPDLTVGAIAVLSDVSTAIAHGLSAAPDFVLIQVSDETVNTVSWSATATTLNIVSTTDSTDVSACYIAGVLA